MVKTEPDICNTLRSKIEEALTPLVDSDYLFLDLPYYSNNGDALIWLGTEHFLENIPYECLGKHNIDTFDFRPLPKDTIILLQGGGNFGDIWRQHQDFRLKVMQQYAENRIIVLPQTVFYESEDALAQDVQQMNQHRHLTICVRDNQSVELLKKAGYTGQLLLLPDMAFCIDRELLCSDKSTITKEALLLLRNDKESPLGNQKDGCTPANIDIKDWPGLNKSLRAALKFIKKHPAYDTDLYFQTTYLPERIREGVKFASAYKEVYSTRLHMVILRLLLGMPVKLMNNSYGKNMNFYKTWLQDAELVALPNEEEQKMLDQAICCLLRTQARKRLMRKLFWGGSILILLGLLTLYFL